MQHPKPERLQADLAWLEQLTEPERPYTRRAFTDLFLAARRRLQAEMEAVGLRVRLDAAGNLIGRLEGQRANLPPLMVGSHIDTVVGGGRFDGIIGVLAGVEVVRWLRDNGLRLQHPLEVVDFLSEEPSDYGISTVGSRGMVGTLTPEMLARTNPAGESLAQGIARMGGNPAALAAPLRRPGEVAGYLELHIEQGPVLEEMKRPVGVVNGIVGVRRWEVLVTGRPDHAGTTPMPMRRDALNAAAEITLAVERVANAHPGAVGTVGTLVVSPNAPNVVPGQVRMLAEVRSVDPQVLDRMEADLRAAVAAVQAARPVEIAVALVSNSAPVVVSDAYQAAQTAAVRAMGLEPVVLASGAGHDGNQVALIAPVGMFFIPCRQGRSHAPEEWAEVRDIAQGAEALGRSLLALDAM